MTVYAADWITHSAVAGSVATALHWLNSDGPLINSLAMLIGFGTHVVLDLLVNEFKGWPPMKYWPWYVVQVIAVTVLIVLSPSLAVWAIIGGLLPDIIDGVYGFLINKDAWMSGNLLFWFHRQRGQTPQMTLGENIGLAIVAVTACIAVIYTVGRW